MSIKLLLVFVIVVFLVGCENLQEARPFTAYDEKLQQLWDGPRNWAEDWCDQNIEFRRAYSAVVAYRMRPYRFSIECP